MGLIQGKKFLHVQKIKFSDSPQIFLFLLAANLILSVNNALATAELDTEELKTAPAIKKFPSVQIKKPKTEPIQSKQEKQAVNTKESLKDEKEIFTFRVPPAVSGNVIPHIPDGLPDLPPDTLFSTPKYYVFKPSAAWRITARSLFEKPVQSKDIQLKLNAPSLKAFKLLQNQGSLPGWSLKDFSENARQIAFEFLEADKPRVLIVAIKDVADGSILRARVTPYANTDSLNSCKNFLSRLQETLEMKDVL